MQKEEFITKCKENNLNLTEEQLANLDSYFHMLVETNKVMNLTAITEEHEVYEKHFYDSLLISFGLDLDHKTLIDVGTGAGFPGLVLAICYPQLKVTLLEPLTKRCNFLNNVINNLKLNNVEVINQRSEDYAKVNREKYDYATARAVARLNLLLEIIIPLVKENGYFIAMKGRQGNEEIDEAKNALNLLHCKIEKTNEVNLFENDDKRINIFIKKVKKTEVKYPRAFGQIKKKPL